MTTSDTDLQQLVINKLTQAQYDAITTPSSDELYFIKDGKIDADDVDDTTSTNKFVTASDITTWNGKQDALVSGTNIKTINSQSLLGSGDIVISGGGSTPYKKTLTNASQNYSVSNNVVTVTDSDVSTSTNVTLYPADTTTETWLENNLSSCIITEGNGSFNFTIDNALPATFSMYYIVMEVQ